MNTWRRISVCSMVLGLLAVVCSSCKQTPEEGRPVASKPSLSVVVREGLEADGIKRLALDWGAKQSVDVKVQTLGRENYEVNVTNDILSPSPKYDVVFFPGTLVTEMAAKRALSPIDGWTPEGDPDLLAYSKFDGRPYGLPCDVSTFFFFYRDDIIKRVPDTWEELLKALPVYQLAKGPHPPKFGLAFAGKAGEELPKIFYPILWSYGGFIIEDGKVGLDTPGGIDAANMFRKFVASGNMPPDLQTWDVGKIYDELQKGTLAGSVPQWNALFPLIKGGTSTYREVIQIAQLPGVRQPDGTIKRVNFKHTWVLVKSAGGKRQDLANGFILYATGKEGARAYAETAKGNPARASILSDPSLQRVRPEFPLLLKSLKIAKAEPDVIFYAKLHRIMNESLSGVVAGTTTPKAAMEEAAKRVRQLLDQG